MTAKQKQSTFDSLSETIKTNIINLLGKEKPLHIIGHSIVYYDGAYYQTLDADYNKLRFFETEELAVNAALDNF